jgi:putative radical SAM enzyme (TIGR03279 family)
LGATVHGVIEDTVAAELGIVPGDILVRINGKEINDIIDYQYYSKESLVLLEIKKQDGTVWEFDIEKDQDEDLGIVFNQVIFDQVKACRNHCMFCFVDQLPPDLRKPLYFKDDDYRYSFLYGNFVTLTNLEEKDWQKIINLRLSPLYVSVHSLSPEVRVRIFNNPAAADLAGHLQRLKNAGIKVHTQIVLCPGINDGIFLEETVEGLSRFYPSVISVGIVPVGLTANRRKLKPLRLFDSREAQKIIEYGIQCQKRFRRRMGIGFVYLADEFFINAGIDFPSADYYDDYCQAENGIGLARILLDDFEQAAGLLPDRIKHREKYIITGVSATGILEKIARRLNQVQGLSVHVIPVPNRFFGTSITVTGLLTGSDIANLLGFEYKGKDVLIPEIALKAGSDVFLDDMRVKDLQEKTGANITVVSCTAQGLIDGILKP